MKKTICFLAALLMLSSSFSAFAATKEDFDSAYNDYTKLYKDVYEPAYHSSNQAISQLRSMLRSDSLTAAQKETLGSFVAELLADRRNFFGTRVSASKSRYDVPAVREKMYAAYSDKNYDSATDLCSQLVNLINARINFLNDIANDINGFDLGSGGQPQKATGTVKFEQTRIESASYYDFEITVANTSDVAMTNWSLNFDYNGTINTVWVDGSALKFAKPGAGEFSIKPANEWQSAYTIPAHSSLVIKGNGGTPGTHFSNVLLNNELVDAQFIKITPPADNSGSADAAVSFDAVKVNDNYYEFTVTIKNNSATPLTNWALDFKYNGKISAVWVDGSSVTMTNNGANMTIKPANEWQSAYTIPAGGSLVIKGNGSKVGNKFDSVSISGTAAESSFSIK